ncbi:MAG: hypothetical protein ABL308_14170 [Oceanicaulis sp.]
MKTRAFTPLFALASAGLFLTACAGTGDTLDPEDVAGDTIGLARQNPDQWRLETDAPTVPTPYGGAGEALSCAAAARDIVRLTVLLGPDDVADPPEGADGEDEEEKRDRFEFASDLAEDAPDMAANAARDAVVGLNPARPVVRFLSGAGETEAEARRAYELALKRRAWLRGAFDASGCEHAVLLDAAQDAGLTIAE